MLLGYREMEELCERIAELLRVDEEWLIRSVRPGAKPIITTDMPYIRIPAADGETAQRLDNKIMAAFRELCGEDGRMYCGEWRRSAFDFAPADPSEQEDGFIKDDFSWYGGESFAFPAPCPGSRNVYFISKDMSFGTFGHIYGHEVWIFGRELVEKMTERTE
ncbi:MAG: DUF2716 domain-containing protein [Ruminococcus sp.]|nr:DUF2716 domain-containing protein [Ruminococcus sp.]